MAEGLLSPGNSPSSSEETRMEEPVVSSVVYQPNTTCAQCKKEVKSPHLLCCLHSVCVECLPGMAVEGQRIKCGECGDTSTHCSSSKGVENQCGADIVHCVPVPNGPLSRYMEGVMIVRKASNQALAAIPCGNKRCKTPNSPSTVFCTDCSIFMCKCCSLGHEVSAPFEDHTVKNVEEMGGLNPADCQQMLSKSPTANTCPQHGGKVLEYCCKRCSLLMCQTCAINSKPHKPKHIPADPTVAEPHRQAFKAAHQATICFRKKCEAVEEQLQTELRTVEQTTEASLGGLNAAFQSIHELVERRKEELHRQIINAAEEKKRAIGSKLKSVKSEKKTASHVESTLELLLNSSNTHDLLASKGLIQTHQSFLNLKWCGHDLETTVSSMLSFEAANQLAVLKALNFFGIVTDGACPKKCTVEPKSEQLQSTVKIPATLKVMAFDSKGIACTKGGDKIEAFLHPKPRPTPGPAIKARVVDNDNGTYSVSFPSVYPGPCVLSIKVNKRNLKGSPFDVTLHRHTQCIKGSKGRLQFSQQPGKLWGVTVSQEGFIYVSDMCNDKIHVFDKDRNYITSFSSKSQKEIERTGTWSSTVTGGLAVGSNGLLYVHVASYFNSCISVFKADGTFVRKIGSGLSGKLDTDDRDCGVKYCTLSIATHNRYLYIADTDRHRVSVYTLEGKHVLNFGEEGKGPGQFINPRAVAFSPDGKVYVTDQGNHRVQVFDAKGKYKRVFGQGQLKSPHGIVISNDGDVLVADQGNNRIAVFSTCGNTNNLVHSFMVECPTDLAIYDGNILVTEPPNKRVVVF